MLDSMKPDIVSVCTWPHLHREVVMAAAETSSVRGIICEKPLALGLRDMQDMIAACEKAGIRLAIGHQLRYQRRHELASDLIRSGTLGEIERIWATSASGDLMGNAIHTIDLVLWYCGDAQASDLCAQVDAPVEPAYRFGHPVERTAVAIGRITPAGQTVPARLVVESGGLWGRGYHHIVVEGSTGRMEVNRPDGPPLRVDLAGHGGWETVDIDREPDPSVGAARELFEAVEQGRDPRASGQAGYRSAEFVLAVYGSALKRGPIHLPLSPDGESPLHAFFRWDGAPRGGRGTVYSTDGSAAAGKIV
jgi:predicted dehydrogenase